MPLYSFNYDTGVFPGVLYLTPERVLSPLWQPRLHVEIV